MSLSDFPPELLLTIITHLDAAGRNALACTNRGVHNLLNEVLYYWDVTQPLSRSLIWGAKNGVESTIQWAVDAAQKFNPIPKSFHIALQIAAKQGHVPIVELLLKVHGINPNFQDGRLQATPLHLAAKKGHSAIVELLLAIPNVNPDVKDRKLDYTPLMYACWKGHVSIVQQLLARNDVDFNARGGYEDTPLILACRRRHLEIINLLLAKDSVDINLAFIATPFIAAARTGLMEVVESLLAREDFDPNIVTDSGVYALGDAACEGNVDVMKLLLDRPDVDPNFAGGSANGKTPLILGARFPNVVKLLLDQQGIDINYQENDLLSTALINTAVYNYVESAKLLLERDDINVNIPNWTGLTALHWACLNESLDLVDLLLKRDDIDLNTRDVVGNTPFALACRKQDRRSIPIIRSLLSHRNTDPNILNSDFMKYRHTMDRRYADEIESLLRKAGSR
ncbi:Ankyrin repeat-containing domain protein [Elaphomyces granulatus]